MKKHLNKQEGWTLKNNDIMLSWENCIQEDIPILRYDSIHATEIELNDIAYFRNNLFSTIEIPIEIPIMRFMSHPNSSYIIKN